MADLNHVVLVGRLTRDAVLKYTASGASVSSFSIAVNRKKKAGESWVEEASFFDVVLWGRQAEVLEKYLVKGKQIAIDGELHQNRWEQDGQTRSKIEIMAGNVQLLGGGTSESGRGATSNGSDNNGHQPNASSAGATPARAGAPLFDDTPGPDFPDDIPF